VVRRVTLLRRRGGRALPALGLAAWWVARPEPELRLARGGALLDGRRVPLDEEGRVLLRFRGPSGTHRTLPAAAVLQSELRLREGGEPPIRDASLLRDRIVLIGATAPGLLDLRAAPVDPVYPGVEIHATLLDNLLAGDALRDAPAALWWAATGLLVLLAAGATVLLCRGWGEVALVCLALAPLPAALAFAAYPLGYWWPLVAPAGAVLTALGGGVAARYALEEREKAFVTRAFQHYLSPAVMEQVLAEPERLRLGGERRELSIFFSDLQGFTSLSEGLEPEALVALLNEYLTEMTDLILAADGTLDKYEGDAILAFWNAPVGQADHAARAAATARRCQQALARRRREWAARCGTELQMRIGIHTGEVIVGNLGSRARFDYTVLGDAANLASRLEGANKFFGTVTMVSEATWRGAGGAPGRELGRLRVVGRQEPVRVYELFAAAPPDWLPAYEAALAAVRAGDWARARARFEPLAERDPVAARYAARCREILTGERAGWDGVWALSEK
jgi:adenylate cyclase